MIQCAVLTLSSLSYFIDEIHLSSFHVLLINIVLSGRGILSSGMLIRCQDAGSNSSSDSIKKFAV